MARLAWDQSFLEDYSDHGSSALETSSSDPVLLSITSDHNNNVSLYQNFNSNPFLNHSSNELNSKNVEFGRIYQNLLCFHNYINTNLSTPYTLNGQESDLNHLFKRRKNDEVHSSENLNVHSENHIMNNKLKHLFEEINRKITSRCHDNTYLSSSHLISSYCHHSNLLKAKQSSKLDCKCLEMKCSELINIEQVLPSLNIHTNSPSNVQLSKKYGLVEFLRNHSYIKKFPKNTGSNLEYANFSEESEQDKSMKESNLSEKYPSKNEAHILELNLKMLLQCGFYHGRVSSDEALELLATKPAGTYFLRDSSNPNYLLSLSFKTTRGPTSIRILFQDNLFSLESDLSQENLQVVPRCNSILKLIQHFVQVSTTIFIVEFTFKH